MTTVGMLIACFCAGVGGGLAGWRATDWGIGRVAAARNRGR
jgi:hypothetical protein